MNCINDEILSVLTAAVASINTRKGYRLKVKSFRRVPQNSPAWNVTGRIEMTGNAK